MKKTILISVRMLLVFLLITGLIYPAVVTGVSQLTMSRQANGSIAYVDGVPAGSLLIGQNFTEDRYFNPRPGSFSSDGYDYTISGGSNLSPSNPVLIEEIIDRKGALEEKNMNGLKVPNDLIMASASGLDPDISVDGAIYQADRIAKVRGVDVERVLEIIDEVKETPLLGLIGTDRINVLKLNMTLDERLK